MEPLFVPAGHMSAHLAAAELGITLSGLRDLVHRGKLTRTGGTPRQPWYDTKHVLALKADRIAA